MLLSILMLMMIVSSFVLIRNEMVNRYRTKIIYNIYNIEMDEIRHITDFTQPYWSWRYEVYENVSYDTMLFTFWKRLDSWYREYDFNVR